MSTTSHRPQLTTFLGTYTSRVIVACSKPPPARSLPTPVLLQCFQIPLSPRCLRSRQPPDGSVGLRDEAGTSSAVRTPPSVLNRSGWAVPSRMSCLPKINLLTEGCHELTESFSLSPPCLSFVSQLGQWNSDSSFTVH